jgi:hypothetical protein
LTGVSIGVETRRDVRPSLDGDDLRRSSIEYRKRKLAKLVRTPHLGIVLNEHYEGVAKLEANRCQG